MRPANWRRSLVGAVLGAVLGVAAIALGARLSVALPGTPVPQSAQTLAVLLVGGLLGPIWGPISVVSYLLAGVCGLPVFADGASGAKVLAGPTAGYLVGFVVAAWWMGWCRDRVDSYSHWLLAGLLAHAVVLGFGWARLAMSVGGPGAVEAGVSPFLLGGLWKSLAAAVVLAARGRSSHGRVGPARFDG